MRKVRMFALLAILVWTLPVWASVYIDTSDIPLNAHCCISNMIDCYYGNNIDWNLGKWKNLSQQTWSPSVLGIRTVNTEKIIVRFYFTQEDIDFFQNSKFSGNNTRKPFALEIDVIDKNEVFGKKSQERDYLGYTYGFPSDVQVYYDVEWMDGYNTLTALIPRPDKFEAGKIYQIVFYPTSNTGKSSGEVHLSLQLSVNYKHLAALRNGASYQCDILDLMGEVHGMSSDQVDHLISVDNGSYIPEDAVNGWYYFLAAESDLTYGFSVGYGINTDMCWNDHRYPDHIAAWDRCENVFSINLFDMSVGDDFLTRTEASSNPDGSKERYPILEPLPEIDPIPPLPDPLPESSVKVREILLSDDQNKDTKHELEKEPDVRYHIYSKMENTGDYAAYDIELRYYISKDKVFGDSDDEYIASDWIDSLDAGRTHEDRKTEFENGDSLKTPDELGEYYIYAIAIVHGDGTANKSDEDDKDEYGKLVVKEYIPPPPPKRIWITDPESGEKWKTDKSHSINWETENVPSGTHIRIEYSIDDGKKWYTLDSSTTNDGEKGWEMNKKPYKDIIKKDTDKARIRVTLVEYPDVSATNRFKIDHKK